MVRKALLNLRFMSSSSLKPLSQLVMTTHGVATSLSSPGDDIISYFSGKILQLLA